MHPWQQRLTGLLLLGSAIGGTSLYLRLGHETSEKIPAVTNPVSHPDLRQLPVDLQGLATAANSVMLEPTPEQIAEHGSIIREQIADATASLRDVRPEERVIGAEQLAAYPTAEAERLLVHALKTDGASEVRKTAAASLQQVESPAPSTLNALFDALEDRAEEVQQAAFDTLTSQIDRLDDASRRHRKLTAKLRQKLGSKHVAADVRDDIRGYLSAQTAE